MYTTSTVCTATPVTIDTIAVVSAPFLRAPHCLRVPHSLRTPPRSRRNRSPGNCWGAACIISNSMI
eukprot:4573544-Pyramimonas_sp.AAC.1